MTIFCVKKLTLAVSVGKKLRAAREALNLTLTQVATQTHIQAKYLAALEAGEFSKLPKARAFRLAYIKEYAEAMGLPGAALAAEFTRQDGLEDTAMVHPHRKIKNFPFASLSIAARNLAAVGLAVLFVGYLAWEVRSVVQPPALSVASPREGEVIAQLNTFIAGATEPEAQLQINGQNAVVNDQGKFVTPIDLSPGINTITVTAVKKHGKSTTITRHLIVRQKNVAALPIAPQP